MTGCTAWPMRTTPAARVLLDDVAAEAAQQAAVRYSGMPNWYLPVMIQA